MCLAVVFGHLRQLMDYCEANCCSWSVKLEQRYRKESGRCDRAVRGRQLWVELLNSRALCCTSQSSIYKSDDCNGVNIK